MKKVGQVLVARVPFTFSKDACCALLNVGCSARPLSATLTTNSMHLTQLDNSLTQCHAADWAKLGRFLSSHRNVRAWLAAERLMIDDPPVTVDKVLRCLQFRSITDHNGPLHQKTWAVAPANTIILLLHRGADRAFTADDIDFFARAHAREASVVRLCVPCPVSLSGLC